MRRVARHVFTFCSAVSLVLCVAVCVLWVTGYQAARIAFSSRPGQEVQAATSRGSAWVYWAREPPAPNQSPPGFRVERYQPAGEPRTWGYGPQNLPFAFDVAGLAVGHGPYAWVPGRTASLVI